jgi:hypothetical protein
MAEWQGSAAQRHGKAVQPRMGAALLESDFIFWGLQTMPVKRQKL